MAGDTTSQDRAITALNEKFRCDNGAIGLDPPVLRHLTATKATGPDLFDFEKLTLGEIVDCLADAGLLASSELEQLSAEVERLASEVSGIRRSHREAHERHRLALIEALGPYATTPSMELISHIVDDVTRLATESQELRADQGIRQGALNGVLGRPASTDYYEAIQAVADLVNERRRLTTRLEAEGLPRALLHKGVRGLLDQVDAMAQQIKALQAQLDQAPIVSPARHEVQIKKTAIGSSAWCPTCRSGVGGEDEYALAWKEGHESLRFADQLQANSNLPQPLEQGDDMPREPRKWAWDDQDREPDDCTRVVDEAGQLWTRDDEGLWSAKNRVPVKWWTLARKRGQLTEVLGAGR